MREREREREREGGLKRSPAGRGVAVAAVGGATVVRWRSSGLKSESWQSKHSIHSFILRRTSHKSNKRT